MVENYLFFASYILVCGRVDEARLKEYRLYWE